MCPSNRKNTLKFSLFLLVILIAIVLRAPGLTLRPMHTDEAVHAVKFGMLLEDNYYRYDPGEYHGPALNYLTLITAWLESAEQITEIDEFTLRIVPVFFGIVLVALLLMLVPGMSRPVVTAAGLLTAVSPAMVFYSRYYIQEMLLVFFTFAMVVSGFRYIKSMHVGWAVTAGVFLGLMHATKETAVIAAGSMALAFILTRLTLRNHTGRRQRTLRKTCFRHSILLITAAFTVSTLLYSSFFTNPGGIADSYAAYTGYFRKAAHNDWHIQPWYYYLKILLYSKGFSGPVWSEALIVMLAAAGIVASVFKKGVTGVDTGLLRFLSLYTLLTMVIYSAIPYKTPWNMLGFLHGLIVLAGVGAIAVIHVASRRIIQISILLVLAIGCINLAYQSYASNYEYYADPANPYTYAHPAEDVYRVTRRIDDLAGVHPDGKNMYIEVIGTDSDYWPLPWYLRSYPNIGWWNEVNMDGAAAPVIIATPDVERDIIKKLYEIPPPSEKNLYVPLFESYTELRPTVEIRGYVVQELWNTYQQNRDSSSQDYN